MSAAAAQTVNPNADVLKKGDASNMNINAARGLQDVLKSNLGPKGTLKMLVSGAGDIKLTKDGKVLLTEEKLERARKQRVSCDFYHDLYLLYEIYYFRFRES